MDATVNPAPEPVTAPVRTLFCKDCVLYVPGGVPTTGTCHLNPPDGTGYPVVNPTTDWCGFLR